MRVNSTEEDPLVRRFRDTLTPGPIGVDPTVVCFEAGCAVGRAERSGLLLKSYAAAVTTAAAVLACVAFAPSTEPSPQSPQVVASSSEALGEPSPVESIAVEQPEPAWSGLLRSPSAEPHPYLVSRDRALRFDLFPRLQSEGRERSPGEIGNEQSALSAQELLKELLPAPLEADAPPSASDNHRHQPKDLA